MRIDAAPGRAPASYRNAGECSAMMLRAIPAPAIDS